MKMENRIIGESKIDSKVIEWCATHFKLNGDELTMNGCYIDLTTNYKTGNNLYLGYGLYCLSFCPKLLFEYDIDKVEAYKDFDKSSSSRVACIGFSESKQGWLGWSHRAYFFFKIGYVVEEGTLCTDTGYIDSYAKQHPERCFNLPAGFTCKTLDDCRKCAIAYAMAVA